MTLWTSAEIAGATGGTVHGDFVVDGATFDSREVQPGDLFIAMPGTAHDGHDFVAGAFDQGAHGALVSQSVDVPHVLVEDVTEALDALAKAARARLSVLRETEDGPRLYAQPVPELKALREELSAFSGDRVREVGVPASVNRFSDEEYWPREELAEELAGARDAMVSWLSQAIGGRRDLLLLHDGQQ